MKWPIIGVVTAVTLLGACENVLVEPLPSDAGYLDDRLTITGQVCTQLPNPADFPVKVVFLVDESGSMCITDPPGSQSQNNAGICQTFSGNTNLNNYCEPDGSPHPGRVCALYDLINQFADSPNVEATLVPFETKIIQKELYPANEGFVPIVKNGANPNYGTWLSTINSLQSSLGQGTDYQGALSEVYTRIATDVLASPKTQLPRTRYVVIFLTDGVPFPRCVADDNLPAADYAPTNPNGLWPDSPGASCPGTGCFCTTGSEAGQDWPDFTPGTDRNQDYQILDVVDQIMGLQSTYDIADIRIHAVLLWNTANISQLSLSEQQDIFGQVGSTNNPVQVEHDVAEALLQKIAVVHGKGTFQEFNDVASVQLGSLDYTSLTSPYVLKSLIVQNLSSRPHPPGSTPDSDGDGLDDNTDNSFIAHTSPFNPDSDQDCFDDNFEYTHQAEGFNPAVPDPRGCLPTGDSQPVCLAGDSDHDGVSNCEEQYLGTDPTLIDSDADGLPDGLKVEFGLNPLVPISLLQDTDGDGIPDIEEIKAHTDPLVPDANLYATEGYRYAITPSVDGGVNCYDFSVSNIKMVTPQSVTGEEGYNYFMIYFDQAPQGTVTQDYGIWSMACAVTQFAPPSVRVPEGPTLDVTAGFVPADQLDHSPLTVPQSAQCIVAQ